MKKTFITLDKVNASTVCPKIPFTFGHVAYKKKNIREWVDFSQIREGDS